MSDSDFYDLGQTIIITILLLVVALVLAPEHRKVRDLEKRVACLEHPHGESSTAGRFVVTEGGRRFVVTQLPARTGC